MRNIAQKRQKASLIVNFGTEHQVVTAVLDIITSQGKDVQKLTVLLTTLPNSPIIKSIATLEQVFFSSVYQGKVS